MNKTEHSSVKSQSEIKCPGLHWKRLCNIRNMCTQFKHTEQGENNATKQT